MEQTQEYPTFAQVEADLRSTYPLGKALLSVAWESGAQYHVREGMLDDVMAYLRAFCAHWPEARLRYQPQHPYGLVCRLLCQRKDMGRPGPPEASATLFVTAQGTPGPDLGVNGPPRPRPGACELGLSRVA